jgi:hypothetical protein
VLKSLRYINHFKANMAFKLSPATEEDALPMSKLSLAAFSNDELSAVLVRRPPPDSEDYKVIIQHGADNFVHLMKHDPSVRMLKVTDEGTNEIVALGQWHVPTKGLAAKKNEAPFPKEFNKELFEHFMGSMKVIRERHINTETDYCMF